VGREALKLHKLRWKWYRSWVRNTGQTEQNRQRHRHRNVSPEPYRSDDSGRRSSTEPQWSSSILAGGERGRHWDWDWVASAGREAAVASGSMKDDGSNGAREPTVVRPTDAAQ
jgi:hypothetical protein